MNNPWDSILLEDYENHMNSDSVRQYHVLNKIMNAQLNYCYYEKVVVLGSGGGNGLEYANANSEIYCVDVNSSFLDETMKRYSYLKNLKTLCLDLASNSDIKKLPRADLIIANLLIEYIGYKNFELIIQQSSPKYITCVIQIDNKETFISDSAYNHKFDNLKNIHCNIESDKLTEYLTAIGYKKVSAKENSLPNKKILLQLNYENIISENM